MLRVLIAVIVVFLCQPAYGVDLRWDTYIYDKSKQNIIFVIFGTHDENPDADSDWTIIHDNVSGDETTKSVPNPLKTTTYAMIAVDLNKPVGDPDRQSGLSEITADCTYVVDVVPEEDPAPPEPIIIVPEPEPEPSETPVEQSEPIVEDIEVEEDHSISFIRLVDCRSTEDVNEQLLCGENNNHPYLMAESTKKVSKYIISTTTVEFIEPHENNELFYDLINLPYGIHKIGINSDDDAIEFSIKKGIFLEGIRYEILVGDDDRFIDPLIIHMPVPVVQENSSGGCFITTIWR